MIEIIKAAFAAGEVKTFLIQGEYLEILESAFPIDVQLMDRSGVQLSTMRSAEASYFSRPGKYETIQITSAFTQTIKLFVGTGDAGTRKLSGLVRIDGASDVSVIDGEKNRTLLGGMAAAAPFIAAPGVGQFGYCCLHNPASSIKRLIVTSLSIAAATATQINVSAGAGFPANDVTSTRLFNKLNGAVWAGIAVAGWGLSAAIPVNRMWGAGVAANSLTNWNIKGAFVLQPGFGLFVWNETPNHSILANYEFFEELNA